MWLAGEKINAGGGCLTNNNEGRWIVNGDLLGRKKSLNYENKYGETGCYKEEHQWR